MLRLNRKGNYPLMMIITCIICTITLIVSVGIMYDSLGQKFGVVQSAVLDLTGDMRLVETQLELSSKFAMEKALADLPKSPQVGRGCDFGHVQATVGDNVLFCPILNDPELPSDVCVPDVLSSFNDAFNAHLDTFITNYNEKQPEISIPLQSFEIMPFREYTAVIGTKPVTMKMRAQTGFEVGMASFRPAFKTQSEVILSNGYPSMINDAKNIASSCHAAQNITECIEGIIQPPETYHEIDGKYAVIYPWNPTPWCFAFSLGPVEV